MKSEAKKSVVKNLILLIVSAALLIGTTLAWFTTVKTAEINNFQTYIGSESSDDVFYEAIDQNHNNAINIDSGENYVAILTNEDGSGEIQTYNMIPGQKYFYKVSVGTLRQGSTASLVFGNIDLSGNSLFSSFLYVETTLVNQTTGIAVPESKKSGTLSSFLKTIDGINSATTFTCTNLNAGTYDVYYNFWLNTSAPKTFQENGGIEIGSIKLITSAA